MVSDLPLLPWEAFDADHPDHDDWVTDTGRCFDDACPRHPHTADTTPEGTPPSGD